MWERERERERERESFGRSGQTENAHVYCVQINKEINKEINQYVKKKKRKTQKGLCLPNPTRK
jgi:hypothetical protein